MGLLDEIVRERRGWPVGPGVVERYETDFGHNDDRFSPAQYGDYIATSNDIFSVIMLRARLISRQQIRFYDSDLPVKKEITGGVLPPLLRWVNPFWTRERLLMMTEMCLGLWGEAFWAVSRGRSGRPSELWWVKPTQMTPVPHPEKYLAGYLYQPANGGQPIPFATDEVVWMRYPNPLDEFSPLPPLAAARLAADAAGGMMRANKRLFDQGMIFGGIVTPNGDRSTFSTEQAEDLERALERRHKGADRAHRWGVLRFDASVTQMGVTPRDSEWLAGLNATFRQVCRAYGIPSPLLNDLEHATLANLREFQKALWEHALQPECEFIAAEIREQLAPLVPSDGIGHVAFDLSNVPALQESEQAVWDRERGQIEVGSLTINEWRTRRGMPPVEWGDVWWAPVNKAPILDGNGAGIIGVQPASQASADPDRELAAGLDDIREFLAATTR